MIPSINNQVAHPMFDPPPAGSAEERRQKAASEASTRAYHAVDAVALLLEDPAHITDEPIWKGASSTRRQARPLTHIQAAVWLHGQMRQQMHTWIAKARGAGASWQEIAVVLDLVDEDRKTPYDQAVAAFELAADYGFSDRYYSYECGTCGDRVRDFGPYESHPTDQEEGHTETCARQTAAIAAWKARNPE